MKFLVDAHLPPGLCALLRAAGHDALHTRELPAQNQTPDQVINNLSLKDQRVVVSKDTDFYYSHLLHQKPWKLLLVRTGNMSTRDLKRLFEAHLPAIVQSLETQFACGIAPAVGASRGLSGIRKRRTPRRFARPNLHPQFSSSSSHAAPQ